MYGYDREEWQAALLKEIDADQLPACFGGTMKEIPNKVHNFFNIRLVLESRKRRFIF